MSTLTDNNAPPGSAPGPAPGQATFEQAAEDATRQLQAAFMHLITAAPADITNSAELHRALGINQRLGWQVYRVAHASDPLAAAAEVPKPAAMRRVIDGARGAGLPGATIDEVAEASAAFERVVLEHAGDRRSFDSIVSSLAGAGPTPLGLQQRRAAFEANSHLFGVQARSRLACYCFHPSDIAGTADLLILRGFLDMRWLRKQQAPFILSRFRSFDNDGVERHTPTREPIDAEQSFQHGHSLLGQFCSDPPPVLRAELTREGFMQTEIVGEGVGNGSARTFIAGEVLRGAESRQATDRNPLLQISIGTRVPMTVLSLDVLVHEGTFGPIEPEVFSFSDTHCMDGRTWGRESDLLPPHATLKYLGRGPDVMHSPDVPRYPEMVRYAMDKRGWDAARFDVWRCRVEYPVLPSTTTFQFHKQHERGSAPGGAPGGGPRP